MMIAPKAEIDDGLVEYVRWGPIGRLGLIRNLPGSTTARISSIRWPSAKPCAASSSSWMLPSTSWSMAKC